MTPLMVQIFSLVGSLIVGYAARHFNPLGIHADPSAPATPAAPIAPSSPLANGVTTPPATPSLLTPAHPIMAQFAARMETILSQALEAMLAQVQAPIPQPVQVITPPPNPFLPSPQPANVTVAGTVAGTVPAVVVAAH